MLSSTTEYGIDAKGVVTLKPMKWLEKNQSELYFIQKYTSSFLDLKKLRLVECDWSAGDSLAKIKKYDYVMVHKDAVKTLKNVPINSKELAFGLIRLDAILGFTSARADTLIYRDSFEKFTGFLPDVGLAFIFIFVLINTLMLCSSNFQSLEKFDTVLYCMDNGYKSLRTLNYQWIIQFCDSVDTKFKNLKLFTFDISERYFNDNCSENGISNIPPNHFNKMVNYKDELVGYNGRTKARFVHNILVYISPDFEKTIKEHCKKVQKGLPDFEYCFWVENEENNYCLKRTMDVAENLEVETKLRFIRRMK